MSLEGSSISHYRIESELGRGGMGVVYKAVDTKLDRTVALKLLPSSALTSEEDRSRFYREAKAAAQLHHPHIASIFEIDEAVIEGTPGDEPRPFIAMEFIEGQPLDTLIKGSPLPLPEVVNLAGQIAEALSEAHSKDIVHRDIKSANVMVTKAGKAKVLDFGLAKTAQSTMLTRMGSTMGTISYMSPEQARGEAVDHRTDLWALGVIIHEMTTGALPFGGDYEQAIVYSIMNEDAEPLTALRTGVPMELERIVNKLMAKKASSRYASASDLMVDLENLAGELKSIGESRRHSVRMEAPEPVRASSKQDPVRIGLVALVVLLGLATVWLTLSQPDAQTDVPPMSFSLVIDDMESVSAPSLSPDGRQIAFIGVDTSSTEPKLYIRQMDSGQQTEVTGFEGYGWPSWSPDGSRIALADSDDNVWVMRADGSNRTNIGTYSNSLAVWSSDQSLLLDPEDGIIREFRLDGSGERVVANPDTTKGERYFWWPHPLPGGPYALFSVIYEETSDEDSNIHILNLETGEHELLIEDGMYPSYVSSGHVLFFRGDEDMLMAQPFSPEDRRMLGPAVDLFPAQIGSMHISESSDILIHRKQAPERRFQFSFLESDRSPFSITLGPADIMHISRSGTVSVSRAITDDAVDLVLLDPQTQYEQVVTRRAVIETPVFNQDESQIAFQTTEDGTIRIQAMDIASREQTLDIPIGDGLENLILHAWHPDGDHILFAASRRDTRKLSAYVLDLESGEIKALLDPSIDVYNALYHPDGDYLAYTETTSTNLRVWVGPSDGSGRVQIQGNYVLESWLPDEDALLLHDIAKDAIVKMPVSLGQVIRPAGTATRLYESDEFISAQAINDGSILLWELDERDRSRNRFDIITSFRRYLNEVAAPLAE